MSTADNATDTKKMGAAAILLAIAIIVAVLSSMPSIQQKIKAGSVTNKREILAKVSTFYGAEQSEFLILKVKDPAGLTLEIYQVIQGVQSFKQKFDLTQDTDAYITLNRDSTNLALSDVDRNGQLDLVAPSVDRNGNLRLNTYKFNEDLKIFEPFTTNSL